MKQAAPTRTLERDRSRTGRLARHAVAGFSICEFDLRPGYRMGAHAHDRSGLVLPLSGRFRAVASGRALDVAEDQIAVLPGDTAHHETVGPGGARCLLVIPDDPSRLGRVGVDLDVARSFARPDLARTGRLLARELAARDASTSLIVESLLLDLFAASAAVTAEEWSGAPAWVLQVEALVQDRFADPLTHGEIAREFGVTREHLARTFRRYAGTPLGAFVRRIRVLRAARELRHGRPIAQVAVQCGFADHSHLGRAFRAHFRQTPAQYRSRVTTDGQRPA